MLRREIRSSLIALVLAVIATTASGVAPQRTFVASYGLDTNPCSLASPCRGFQAAIDAVAQGGEVVAIDTAGYGAMAIHKSVSVIVPTGVHAGLSPSSGIPIPGYPGQYTVVLIDVASTDVVVLRGLVIAHQGNVTGGIDWVGQGGGIVHVENTVVSGFPVEGLYMEGPGQLYVKDSILRDNYHGLYANGNGYGTTSKIFGDRVHIENSQYGVLATGIIVMLSDSTLYKNYYGSYLNSNTQVFLTRCTIANNLFTALLNQSGAGIVPTLVAAGSTFVSNGGDSRIGVTDVGSLGNNSNDGFSITFDSHRAPE